MTRPVLKWVGGKRKLLEQLVPLLPVNMQERRVLEPFLGGGALFFHLEPEKAVLNDVNAELITTYTAIQRSVGPLIDRLSELVADFPWGEDNYYAVRNRYNEGYTSLCERAALFIYLNRTCFNGLYRVNKIGGFNVPVGAYKNPRILDEEGLRAASKTLQAAQLSCADYQHVLVTAKDEDFVYFDPPYVPVSKTSNFTSYTADGFGPDNQRDLRKVFEALRLRGCKVMLSNSDTPEFREMYRGYPIHEITAARSINASGDGRGKIKELVVTSY